MAQAVAEVRSEVPQPVRLCPQTVVTPACRKPRLTPVDSPESPNRRALRLQLHPIDPQVTSHRPRLLVLVHQRRHLQFPIAHAGTPVQRWTTAILVTIRHCGSHPPRSPAHLGHHHQFHSPALSERLPHLPFPAIFDQSVASRAALVLGVQGAGALPHRSSPRVSIYSRTLGSIDNQGCQTHLAVARASRALPQLSVEVCRELQVGWRAQANPHDQVHRWAILGTGEPVYSRFPSERRRKSRPPNWWIHVHGGASGNLVASLIASVLLSLPSDFYLHFYDLVLSTFYLCFFYLCITPLLGSISIPKSVFSQCEAELSS